MSFCGSPAFLVFGAFGRGEPFLDEDLEVELDDGIFLVALVGIFL